MPALEIIALDTTTPQLRAPPSGSTYSAPRAIVMTPETLTGSAATSSLSIAQTWNTTGTPTAIDLNVTDTASNAASLLFSARVGGSDRFSVDKTGAVVISDGTSALTIDSTNGTTTFLQTAQMSFQTSNALIMRHGNGDSLGFRAATSGDPRLDFLTPANALRVRLTVDGNGILAQRNGVNAQAFNIYNTFTDASNYARGFVRWSSNRFEIGADALGTGTRRNTTIFNRDIAGSFAAQIDHRLEVDGGASSLSLSFRYGGGIFFEWGINGTPQGSFSTQGFSVGAGDFGGSTSPSTAIDAGFMRIAANVTGVVTRPSGSPVGGALEFLENTAPAAPAANRVRIYAEDNGSGKTRLMALFATGAAQQIAIEP